ncbi:uncharacterized protein LOC125261579 [Megalobrama amblycephala]|uniref:uncharacterized protein LOC125261579 n=1 Tax=Megalobrama amblycephala TaxID=75352 RepID=UPI0020146B21|nr:uncharacterized protein LOC125261579 [Megalobrama amblycephala]
MNAVNSVQLFLLVWTFTSVCRADVDDISVNCKNVTGTVKKEVNFTCRVFLKHSECCITKYKFQYPEKYNDQQSTICREEFPQDSCEQRNSFTCRHTPTTAMMRQFRFFVQTMSGMKRTEFTVNITEPSKHETVTEDLETPSPTGGHSESRKGDNTRSTGTVVAAVMGCFFIIIIIMIIMYKRKPNYFKSSRLQKWVFLGRRQEQSPQNEINITDSTV